MQVIKLTLDNVLRQAPMFEKYFGLARKDHEGRILMPIGNQNEYEWVGIQDNKCNYFYARYRDGSMIRYEEAEESRFSSSCEDVVKAIYELRIVAVFRGEKPENVERLISSALVRTKFNSTKDIRSAKVKLKASDTDAISVFIDENEDERGFDKNLLFVSVDFDLEITHAETCCIIDLNQGIIGGGCDIGALSCEELNNGLSFEKKRSIWGGTVNNSGQRQSYGQGDAGDIKPGFPMYFFPLDCDGSDRFDEIEPGAFIDNQTGLMWHLDFISPASDWDTKRLEAINSSYLGFNDWYFPTHHQLVSLANHDSIYVFGYSPLNNTPGYTDTPFRVWTSNTTDDDATKAIAVVNTYLITSPSFKTSPYAGFRVRNVN